VANTGPHASPQRARRRLEAACLAAALCGFTGVAWAGELRHLDGSELSIPLAPKARAVRDVALEDLMGLRELKGLSISPDARYAVTLLNAPDVARDGYRAAWFVIDLSGAARPRNIGDAGEPQLFSGQWRLDGKRGERLNLRAQWSPDSRSVAYLRQWKGRVQVWRSPLQGAQQQVTSGDGDVSDFVWHSSGERITFAVVPDRATMTRRLEAAERDGFRVTVETKWSFRHNRPFYTPPEPDLRTVDLKSLVERPATAVEREFYAQAKGQAREVVNHAHTPHGAGGPGTATLRADPSFGLLFDPPRQLEFAGRASRPAAVRCADPLCRGYFAPVMAGGRASTIWADPAAPRLLALRLSGADQPGNALVSIDPGNGRARAVFASEDLLTDCHFAARRLVCLQQTTDHPRRVLAIDTATGRAEYLFDPNPEWGELRKGETQWLRWADAEGNLTYGVLVKPIGYDPKGRYPLVVIGYGAGNALHGDAAGRYPAQAFAAEGIAALVYSLWRPQSERHIPDRVSRGFQGDVPYARVPFQQISAIVDRLAEQGLVDRGRVGVGGHSSGLDPLAYGLIHSDLFRAASASWIRWNESGYFAFRDVYNDELRAAGVLRDPSKPKSELMEAVSLSANAAKVRAPMLVHASDSEFIGHQQIEALWRFHDAGRPLEMHVYPDEDHIFVHPAHRYSENRRNLQWFKYWLTGQEAPDPVDPDQYRRWGAFRRQLSGPASAP
jgi:dipeptidyl aminopeptidase/acylaminoacyl peptidase